MTEEKTKLALPEWLNTIAVFDTETTGLNHSESRIVTAALHLIDVSGALTPNGKDWLLNPGIPIPAESSKVHGIYDKDVVNAQSAQSGVGEIVDAINECFAKNIPVVAFNASYDFTILKFEALRHGIQPVSFGWVIDPLVIDRAVDKFRKGKRTLVSVAEHYGVPLVNAHTAADDAIAAGHVAYAVLRFFSALNNPKISTFPDSLQELHDLQAKWADEREAEYAKWRQQEEPNFQPSFGWPVKND